MSLQPTEFLNGSLVLRPSAQARGENHADSDGNDVADRTNTSELWSIYVSTPPALTGVGRARAKIAS
jgi:hypothetical protein